MHVVGTAGHVDHGKSTLVKALTGMDPDRFEEEKARGLTIDLGFAWMTLPSGREVGVVDVPGHERFIRNMLAGVGSIDACIFVVAADEGFMPQSAEHLAILDFLQVRSGVVAVTKMDLVDEETLAVASDEIAERLAGTALEGAPMVPVSAVTGEGLDELRARTDDMLATAGTSPDRGRPRLFVDRSFTITGAGTVVTGTLTGGRLSSGDEVEILPEGETARVRSMQTHRRVVTEAPPGSRVALNLAGLERSEVSRGDALVRPGDFKLSDTFAARLRAARDLSHPLAERGAYELFVGSAEVPCRLKFLEELPLEGRTPSLPAGAETLVQVFCFRPLPLEPHDRFIVRDVGRWETVAGGVVIDHFPGRVRRGDEDVLDRLRARERASRNSLILRLVAERGAVVSASLGPLTGLGPSAAADILARATEAGEILQLATHVVSADWETSTRASAVDALDAFHEASPLEAGMSREALRAKLALEQRLFAEITGLWTSEGAVVAEGALLRLPTHTTAFTAEQEEERTRVLDRLREAGVSPPEVAELGVPTELVKALERAGDVVLINPQVAYASDVMADVERRVVELIDAGGPATVAQVRDAIGTTRKFAVPLLEHLDARGVTRRQGDARILGPRGKDLASSLGADAGEAPSDPPPG